MAKIITMVLYNRPDYTRQVVEALRHCVGVEEYLVLPHIEPGNEQVVELARAIDFAEVEVTVNPRRLGCGRNTFAAWEDGFSKADFIIHVEDDTVPARDCLRLMEHCRTAYAEDQSILSVCAYHREYCPAEHYYKLGKRSAYNCWLVALWRDRWPWIQTNWNPDPARYATFLCDRAKSKGYREIYPLLSRSQNIGAERGLHVPSPGWHRTHQHTDHWAGNLDLPPGAYHE